LDRYLRQSVLPWIGQGGQDKLRKSAVLVVGCGGTGCACSSFLARAGIGHLRIVDQDVVGLTDLHRQVLFDQVHAMGLHFKVRVAARRLAEANPEIEIEPLVQEFNPGTAESLIGQMDVIADCSDNFETRLLLNEVADKHSKPWIHGACLGEVGIVIPFPQPEIACYRCLMDHIPNSKSVPGSEEVGILGPVAGMVGCLEAVEAIKMLVVPDRSVQKIILLDTLSCRFQTLDVKRKIDCPVCVQGSYELLNNYREFEIKRGYESGVIHINLGRQLDLERIKKDRASSFAMEDLGGILRIEGEGKAAVVFENGRAIVRGVADADQARDFLTGLS